jgi:hypothetical protein
MLGTTISGDLMGRNAWGADWRWIRILILGLSAALAAFAGVHQLGDDARERLRAEAAQQLAASVPEPSQAQAPSQAPTPSESASPAKASSTPVAPAVQIALPPRSLSWPAAGLTASVVPMNWNADDPIDPPLDPQGFDPVGHWLTGTGPSGNVRPIVLAGHTCHQGVPLCNDATFPFNRLSYQQWAVGQPASVTDANGQVVNCSLVDRKVVDKSKAFSFGNNPCDIIAFSCNYDDPDGQVVLVTFRCGQCT